MSDNNLLILFTMIVSEKLSDNYNLCFSLLKEIEKQYELSKKQWSKADGLFDIYISMSKFIEENKRVFYISPLTKRY